MTLKPVLEEKQRWLCISTGDASLAGKLTSQIDVSGKWAGARRYQGKATIDSAGRLCSRAATRRTSARLTGAPVAFNGLHQFSFPLIIIALPFRSLAIRQESLQVFSLLCLFNAWQVQPEKKKERRKGRKITTQANKLAEVLRKRHTPELEQ